jgi:hypothetical protein
MHKVFVCVPLSIAIPPQALQGILRDRGIREAIVEFFEDEVS